MSESKAYTPRQIWAEIKQFKNPQTGKWSAKKARAFFASLDLNSLYAFIVSSQKFGASAQIAAENWLKRISLAHIAYKEQQEREHGIPYDMHSLPLAALKILDTDIESPFAQWIGFQAGYKATYRERAKTSPILTPQNNASYEILEPVKADTPASPENAPKEALPATNGLSDPRMRGLAYELGMLQECQLWEICQHLSDGSSKVAIATVRTFYQAHMSDAKFYEVLNSKQRSLWFRRVDKKRGYIYYRAYEVVAHRLGRLIPEERLAHYRGNNALGGRVHMPLSGTQQTAMQYAFAAWIERRKKSDSVTLANQTMATIWGVSVRTIRRWKQLCNQQNNFTEQAPHEKGGIQPDIPAHAVETKNGGKLYQISSSYTPPGDVQKHTAQGRSTKARKAFYRAADIAHSTDRLSAIWDTEEQSLEKRYWSQDDIPQAFKKVQKKLHKPTSDETVPRHIRLVTGKRISVWETYTTPIQRVEAVYVA